MKNQLRMAIIGVFDLDNYGDHLFPMMIENYLFKADIQAELVLYSNFETEEGFKTGRHIYSICNLEQDHLQNPFDAIIVAGGEIIHFGHFKHIYKGKEIAYPIYGCFIAASILSAKYGIPLGWNNPGIPFDFEPQYQTIMKEALTSVDYLSVRNKKSAERLKKLDEKYAYCTVSFDTAFAMSDVFSTDKLLSIKKSLNLPDSYIVFHFNKAVSKENLMYIENAIGKLQSMGKQIVLLPIAYTNGDREFLSDFTENHQDICTCISSELSLEEFVAVLGNCELYVGLSYHGAITALAYGKPVVAIDYFGQPKIIDLFEDFDLSDFCLASCETLYNACIKALICKKFDKKYKKAKNEVYRHFDRMMQCLLKVSNKKGSMFSIESVVEMISNISDKSYEMQVSIMMSQAHIQLLASQQNEKDQQLHTLRNQIETLESVRDETANQMQALQDHNAWLESDRSEKENQISLLYEHISELELKINAKEEQTNILNEQINAFRCEREEFIRSTSWRITKPLRFIKNIFSK